MGIIVCQSCNKAIDVFEGEKVTTLYAKGNCDNCNTNSKSKDNK
ncbi:GapA-binding peptide SR1P [Halalkalibacter krulwichiae]|uniref:GapA-binding peptide SR1P n=1 Tax=Halalkalibacter krulwichiae TaxID=199441 RepID=A0A1X9MGC5_9BACI|nr:GapA-binding peptide SR1P [Halalkalibacter krulwichiae]ARK31163.1 hypothetical protein BkAM31D_15610 [Halalkalibacter krulwichiae]